MRRADRLFQIVQILRRRRITTAARLSEELEVSLRTVYRDIQDLTISGVPIQGEAGVGYALPKGFDLPPLMFTNEEIEALVLGARLVQSCGDFPLRRSAEDVLAKVEYALPPALKARLKQSRLFSLDFRESKEETADKLLTLRRATESHRKVTFRYARADGLETKRTVRPLCLAFTAPFWLLAAWCELREEFRNFRLDRMTELELSEEIFADEPGRTFEDFLRREEKRD